MLAVVVSRADSASERIGEQLLALGSWTEHEDTDRPDGAGGGTVYRSDGIELRTFDALHINATGLASAFDDPDRLFVASRHAGDTGPLLTAHPTGNAGPAEHGGSDASFAGAAPDSLGALLDAFERHAPDGYGTAIECTHHGPTDIDCPSLFVELGSSETEWNDSAGARAVARAILDCREPPASQRPFVGIGGGHYVPRFERIARETDWSPGHMLVDWSLAEMAHPREATDVIRAAFERSGARHAVVEGEYPVVCEVIESLGYRVVSETFTQTTDGVPLATVEAIESAMTTVADGLRFGAPATAYEGEFVVRALPETLTEEAANIDTDAARAAVGSHALAYETEQGGTRPTGQMGLTDESRFDRVVAALAEVLESSYETVEVKERAVIARDEQFSPEKAATLGVGEGPAFGALAAGESVEVDGRTIEPEVVHETRTERFPIE
ncbi:hypothetical protein BRC71_03755 [Halobacteriales archaeon QH_7_65_31]|nr:MAG: hypothetical protein BRC71_03755 [Halobacteriales archaeon QH_7_65_31]